MVVVLDLFFGALACPSVPGVKRLSLISLFRWTSYDTPTCDVGPLIPHGSYREYSRKSLNGPANLT